jgi:peptidoglycan/xylan/chitin deacetylase (PgdA/CDA1 family)
MYPTRKTSMAAVPRIVDALRARGYRFVTVGELLHESHE